MARPRARGRTMRLLGMLLLGMLAAMLLGMAAEAEAEETVKEAAMARPLEELRAEAARLEAEVGVLAAQEKALRDAVTERRAALEQAVRASRETREEAEAIQEVPLEEMERLPAQIEELEDALASLRSALEAARRSERMRLKLAPDAIIPAEMPLIPNYNASAALASSAEPTPKRYEMPNVCANVRVAGASKGSGAWVVPAEFVNQPRQKTTMISSGIHGDHTVDEQLLNLFSQNGTSNGETNLFVADPDWRAQEWGAALPKVLFGLRYMPDVIVGGQTRRTTYSLLYTDAGLALPEQLRSQADHELRVLSLVAFTRTVASFVIDVMKLELPPNLHSWVRLIRDIDRIRIHVLMVTFKDGEDLLPSPSLEALLAGAGAPTVAAADGTAASAAPAPPKDTQAALREILWRLGTDSQWRLYHVDGETRKSYTFLHICTADDSPCTCCRRTVPFLCSLQPPKSSR